MRVCAFIFGIPALRRTKLEHKGLQPLASARSGAYLRQLRDTFIFVGALLLGFAQASQCAADGPEMNIPGHFSVNAAGAYNYTIPIEVPPGTAGMVPALSLDYSSQSGDGLEGLGFSLSGIPAIRRCPATIADNGAHGAVTFLPSDRFCLEGQQLVALGGATYGGNGTEYRTELDGFSRIKSFGTLGDGPAYFMVWTKTGQIMEFGNTPDSHLIPVNVSRSPAVTDASVWGVDKISDTKGNFLKVIYNCASGAGCEDRTQNGQIYPIEIDYTGNGSPPPNTMAPFNSVVFKYAHRQDIVPQYQAGTVEKLNEHLTDILTCTGVPTTPGSGCPSGATTVFDYHIHYTSFSSTTGTGGAYTYYCCGHIDWITKCDGTGTACVNQTTFSWTGTNPIHPPNGGIGFQNQAANGQTQSSPDTFNADFNGDGLTDATVLIANTIKCLQHDSYPSPFIGTGAFGSGDPDHQGAQFTSIYPGTTAAMTMVVKEEGQYNCTGTASFYNTFTTVIDYDGDGFSDVAQKDQDPDQIKYSFVFHNQRDGTFAELSDANRSAYRYYAARWADFNGDGRSDYLQRVVDESYAYPFYSDGNVGGFASFHQKAGEGGYFAKSADPVFVGDFDGDGCSDILYEEGSESQDYSAVYLPCNQSTLPFSDPPYDWLHHPHSKIVLADFNGDGKTDILRYGNDSDNHPAPTELYLSTGVSFVLVNGNLASVSDSYNAVVGDYNADGRADIAFIPTDAGDSESARFYISVPSSDGTGAGVNLVYMESAPSYGNYKGAVAGDWNNDGVTDLWIQSSNQDTQFYYDINTAVGPYVPLLMNEVSNGLGVNTFVVYDRINKIGSAQFYTKGTSATYPTQDVNGAMFVVRNVISGTGLGTCTSSGSTCYSSTYTYGGLVADLSGHGLLGFSSVTITDDQTGIAQTTNYYTQFPFTGLIASQTKTCAVAVCGSAVALNTTVNCYQTDVSLCSNPTPTAFAFTDGDIKRYFVPLRQTTVSGTDTDGVSHLPTTTTTYAYDCDGGTYPCYGNAASVAVFKKLGADQTTKTTTNLYYPADTTNWFIDRLQQSSVLSTDGTSSLTRTSSFVYDATTGLLTDETVEPGDQTCFFLHTHYQYDPFGNKNQAKSNSYNSACGVDRTTSTAYDPASHASFPTSITNTLTQSEAWAYDARFGTPTLHQGPNELLNGKKTLWSYDSFGRKTLETRPDGNITVYGQGYCGTNAPPSGDTCPTAATGAAVTFAYAEPEDSTGSHNQNGPITISFYDGLARLIASDTQTFDGPWVRVSTEYDSKGRIARTSRPYCPTIAGGTSCDTGSDNPRWTTNCYVNANPCTAGVEDPEGRVQIVARPDSSTTTYTYQGVSTVAAVLDVQTGVTQTTTTTKNARGLVAKVVDTNGRATTYAYDVFENLIQITPPGSGAVATTFTYDPHYARHKINSIDPDMGQWTYSYDAYDELISQQDAKSQVTTLSYDALGRVVQRKEGSFNANWNYDGATNGIGKLQYACVRSDAGSGCTSGLGANDYLRSASYDLYGRPSGTTLTIDGASYAYGATYNTDSRLVSLTYPSGFATKYLYVPNLGYLCRIEDNANANTSCTTNTGQIYWTANTLDQEGHLLLQTAGNGVQTTQNFYQDTGFIHRIRAGASNSVANFSYAWDSIGNLLQRQDTIESLTENYCYDTLNRLTNSAANGASCTDGTNKKTMFYDLLGNITKKSDISVNNGYVYGGTGPHAVTSIVTCSGCSVNGVANPSYTYDVNGNMTCELASGQTSCTAASPKTINWTTFNMVDSIAMPGGSGLQFAYGPEHARTKQCVPSCSAAASTTTYLNALGGMEEKYAFASTTAWHDYIMANGQIIAERNYNSSALPATTINYFTLDHLGSVSVVTDSTGAVIANGRLSYDAWGKRRNPDGTDDASCSITPSTTRGFTNQEELDSVCLVNLNARLYDPTLARFISPDPTVEAIYNLQDLNRYTYVLNNPLSLTDPSGLCALGCFWDNKIFRSVAAVVAALYARYELSVVELAGLADAAELSTETEALNAGVAGGIGGAIATGRLSGALWGALEGVAFAGVHIVKADLGINTNTIGGAAESAGMHGLVGGMFSMAAGQNFKSGFLAAGFADLAGDDPSRSETVEVTKAALTGGLGSVLGGGKFANGAVTGAFGYLFNELLRPDPNVNHGPVFNKETEGFHELLNAGFAVIGLATAGGWIADLLEAGDAALSFSQTTASSSFSAEGDFAGKSIADIAGQLRAGTLGASSVPVQVVTVDGSTLIVNTRSALSLMQAGIPQSEWTIIDMTGNASTEAQVGQRLLGNGLTSSGTSTLRITGSGSNASTWKP